SAVTGSGRRLVSDVDAVDDHPTAADLHGLIGSGDAHRGAVVVDPDLVARAGDHGALDIAHRLDADGRPSLGRAGNLRLLLLLVALGLPAVLLSLLTQQVVVPLRDRGRQMVSVLVPTLSLQSLQPLLGALGALAGGVDLPATARAPATTLPLATAHD